MKESSHFSGNLNFFKKLTYQEQVKATFRFRTLSSNGVTLYCIITSIFSSVNARTKDQKVILYVTTDTLVRLRVFENRVFTRIFGFKRDEVTGEWRKLQNEELHDLNFSPSIVRVIKSRRMRWVGHVDRMGWEKTCTGFWW
jgi:hypothetical protein